MEEVLVRNCERKIKVGTGSAFHNHTAAHAIAAAKLGASEAQISSLLGPEDGGEAPGELRIDESNWRQHLGEGVRLLGVGAQKNYAAYRAFFAAQLEVSSAQQVLLRFFSALVPGLLGDIFHAVIELGCFFESGQEAILPGALAWLCTSYVELPRGRAVPLEDTTPLEALRALTRCSLPRFDMDRGSSGFVLDVERIVGDEELLERVLCFQVAGLNERQVREAARESFLAGGCRDFYTLHLVTASNAIHHILAGAPWGVELEQQILSVFWRGLLVTHVARNNLALVDETFDAPASCRSWEDIFSTALEGGDAHAAKVVVALHALGGPRSQWTASESVDKSKGRIRGAGVGPSLSEFS